MNSLYFISTFINFLNRTNFTFKESNLDLINSKNSEVILKIFYYLILDYIKAFFR
jgi:hypothetical protein